MNFASVRLATQAFDTLVAFYATLTDTPPTHLAPGFAELRLGGATLAISDQALIERLNAGAAVAGQNRSAILEFETADVAAALARLGPQAQVVMPPTRMPWGNLSLLLRDPDGSLVNVFSRPAG